MVIGNNAVILLCIFAFVILLSSMDPDSRFRRFLRVILNVMRKLISAPTPIPYPQTPPASLRGLTKMVGDWTSTAFVSAGGLGAAAHLIDEAKELREIMEKIAASGTLTPEDKYEASLELADILILAIDIAYAKKIDLTDALLLKHYINIQRQWGPPDSRGVQHHIELEIGGPITRRSTEEVQRLKRDWQFGAEKLAAVLATPDATIAAALDELLAAREDADNEVEFDDR
jgi:hypothetical protein